MIFLHSCLTSYSFGECEKGQKGWNCNKFEQYIEEATMEDPIEEVKQVKVTKDQNKEVKQVEDTEATSEKQVEETKPRLDCF